MTSTSTSTSTPQNAFTDIHASRSPTTDSLGNSYEILTALPQPATASTPISPSLPTILCLHGAGTSARIFRFQLRNLTTALRSHFNFLFLDGPIPSPPGPGVLPYFEGVSPYYRWVSYVGKDGPKSKEAVEKDWEEVKGEGGVVERLRGLANATKREGEGEGGGEIVGVLGFSQGCRVAAGLLLRQARRDANKRNASSGEKAAVDDDDDGLNLNLNLRFGVFIGGGWPYIRFSPPPPPPSSPSPDSPDADTPLSLESEALSPSFIRIAVPTVHAWGKDDPQKGPARLLMQRCTAGLAAESLGGGEEGSGEGGEGGEGGGGMAAEYEFAGGHHMPMVMSESRELAGLVIRAWMEGRMLRPYQQEAGQGNGVAG
ncbi:MAG: hypothetical protein Q9160_001820 [Pyrenula sp. 1 TL-2023]